MPPCRSCCRPVRRHQLRDISRNQPAVSLSRSNAGRRGQTWVMLQWASALTRGLCFVAIREVTRIQCVCGDARRIRELDCARSFHCKHEIPIAGAEQIAHFNEILHLCGPQRRGRVRGVSAPNERLTKASSWGRRPTCGIRRARRAAVKTLITTTRATTPRKSIPR